jgi:hypothetical protein
MPMPIRARVATYGIAGPRSPEESLAITALPFNKPAFVILGPHVRAEGNTELKPTAKSLHIILGIRHKGDAAEQKWLPTMLHIVPDYWFEE